MKTPQKKWLSRALLASLITNLALVVACLILANRLSVLYAEYRYFRSLPSGSSATSNLPALDPSNDTFILFGDSRVALWHPLPAIGDHYTLNAGVSGETSTEMLRRFDQDVLRHKPEVVLLQAGMNDLSAASTRRVPDGQQFRDNLVQNLGEMITRLQAQNCLVILSSIIPAQPLGLVRKAFWHDDIHTHVASVNKQLERLAQDTGARWFDAAASMRNATGVLQSQYYSDTLHQSPAGYRVLNKALLQLLEK